jgi:hypothetical protein
MIQKIVDPDYYELETHIFFDDAFELSDDDDDEMVVNTFVKMLIDCMDVAASHVHQVYYYYIFLFYFKINRLFTFAFLRQTSKSGHQRSTLHRMEVVWFGLCLERQRLFVI